MVLWDDYAISGVKQSKKINIIEYDDSDKINKPNKVNYRLGEHYSHDLYYYFYTEFTRDILLALEPVEIEYKVKVKKAYIMIYKSKPVRQHQTYL